MTRKQKSYSKTTNNKYRQNLFDKSVTSNVKIKVTLMTCNAN